MKTKILHIIKSLGRGGAEVLLPETLRIHDKEKFEFHYAYFLPWKDQMVRSIEDAGGKVICFGADNNMQLIFRYRSILKYCKDNEIRLIHCHLPWSGFLGRILFTLTDIPVVYTEHNIQEHYHFITRFLNKWSFNKQNMALGVSEDVSRSIQYNIRPQIPVHTLFNGVDTNKFKRDREKGLAIRKYYNIPVDAYVIGLVAVFREQKNIPLWLEVFKNISEINNNIFGLIVGAGPLETEIRSMISELELTEKIILPGLQEETIPYFSAMDIFMMTSSFEGLPIALLEAMSMECAIVSTDAGGIKEVIRNGIDGRLCENPDQLFESVKVLVTNPQELQQHQIMARNRVKKSFSLQTMVINLEKIYEEIGSCN